jgi:mRNA-degrading endonuclease YafQ of YafQ-DinJ toxin-antitoxin module
MYKLEPTKAFEKGLKKLSGNEQRAVAAKLRILTQDPFHPSDCVEKHWQHPPGIVGARISRPCPPICSAGAQCAPLRLPFSHSLPSLRTKKVQGLQGVFECSINMDIRVLWTYKEGKLILLIDIGRHDIL